MPRRERRPRRSAKKRVGVETDPYKISLRFHIPRRAGVYSCRDINYRRRCRDFLLVIEQSTGLFSQIFSAFGFKIWNLVSNPCFLIILKRKKHPSVLFPFWRRCRDLNPGNGLSRLHDFQSCSFGQLGHICIFNALIL